MQHPTMKDLMQKIQPYRGAPNFERVRAVLNGQIPDRVPYFEFFLDDQHVEKLLGRKAGNTFIVGAEPASMMLKGTDRVEPPPTMRPMLAKDWIQLCHIIGQDAIVLAFIMTPIKQLREEGPPTLITDCSVKTRADLDRVVWPTDSDVEVTMQYVREYVAAARGTGIGVILLYGSIFQMLYQFVVGFEDCMVMIMEDRDLFDELMTRSADYFERLIRRAVEEGIDAAFVADDIAMKTGLFVHPRTFREIWPHHYARLLAPARDAKLPIFFHSDGKLDDVIETIIDLGANSLNPMDPSGIDYRDYKKRYGSRITLHGNIDLTLLTTGSAADVEREVREHMEVLKPGGRWICASSNTVPNSVVHDNFVTMINAFHRQAGY